MIINHILIINRILMLALSFLTVSMAFAADCPEIALDVSGAWSDGGYSYVVQGTSGIAADNQNSPGQSTLRLFENGVEMGPPHSLHDDIRNLGQGRFSHWSLPDGTEELLYFSSSDDTDPRTNGKSYSYCLTLSSFHAPAPTSSLVVNVKDTGATGNGVTDDTNAIQAAINQIGGTGGTVLIPDGTYLVTASSTWPNPALSLKSNMTFKMTSGAIIKLRPTNKGTYTVLNIANITNVNVIGGKLQGERHQHLTPGDDVFTDPNCHGGFCYGQWGMGILIGGSSNVYIEAVESREMWGDGFYISGSYSISSNINLYGVTADGNRRQGLSIENVNGMVVRDSVFKNTGGQLPQDGIDIEPFAANHIVTNLQILNNQIFNNKGSGVHAVLVPVLWGTTANISNISVSSNTINANGWTGGDTWYAGVHVESTGGLSIIDNLVTNNIGRGGIVLSNASGNAVTGNTLFGNNTTRGDIFDTNGGNTINNNTITY